MRVLREIRYDTGKLQKPLTLLVASDLHDEPCGDILPMLEGCDALLVPGDIANRYRGSFSRAAEFLGEAAERLPVFASAGNHDLEIWDALMPALKESGVQMLINDWRPFGGVSIGGYFFPKYPGTPYDAEARHPLEEFAALEEPKILLCHKPEHFLRYVKGKGIDLTVAGHAHGGQIRVLGRGLYAPGQGILPRLTHGMPEPGLIVSAGCGNPVHMPRWGNPREVLKIIFS